MNKEYPLSLKGMFAWMAGSYVDLKSIAGEEGIILWKQRMDKGLSAGYNAQGAARGSGVDAFLEHVVKRDHVLGMEAGGHVTNERKFSYWIKDLFYLFKNEISETDYQNISTHGYLATKIKYFLTGEWKATMTKNPWQGHDRTEWIIEKLD